MSPPPRRQPGRWQDLSEKVARVTSVDGPSFINVLADCPLDWSTAADLLPRIEHGGGDLVLAALRGRGRTPSPELCYTLSWALSPHMRAPPKARPATPSRRPSWRNASGAISRATSASIAPAANANETGRRPLTSSTARNATTAPRGRGKPVATPAQNCCHAVKPDASIGIATLVPSGMFWIAMATITKTPRP